MTNNGIARLGAEHPGTTTETTEICLVILFENQHASSSFLCVLGVLCGKFSRSKLPVSRSTLAPRVM